MKAPYNSTIERAASSKNGIFGLKTTFEEARLLLVPVPFEATASFNLGTVYASSAILKASEQLDLYHALFPNAWQQGIYLQEPNPLVSTVNKRVQAEVVQVRLQPEAVANQAILQRVNQAMTDLFNTLKQLIRANLEDHRKIVGLIGGDHSTAFPNIAAHLEQYPEMGLLHIDAHDDLRHAYEGFSQSHASVMYNVLTQLDLHRLVSVGIRDYSEEEHRFALSQKKRLTRFTQQSLDEQLFQGKTWHDCCEAIVVNLPQHVYVSFDIDGLDPSFCPHTGTPVPGGLTFQQAIYLLRHVVRSGRHLVGFDLVEVGSDPYDANVGARLLFELGVLSLAWDLNA